jgi:hypothetical protein
MRLHGSIENASAGGQHGMTGQWLLIWMGVRCGPEKPWSMGLGVSIKIDNTGR